MMPFKNIQKLYYINYFLFFFGFVLFSYFNHRLFSQYLPTYFNFNRDLLELLVIATGLPKYLIAHPALFLYMDVLLILIPTILILYSLITKSKSLIIGFIFSIYLLFYLLLQNIFLQIHLESYVAYILLSLLFMIRSEVKMAVIIKLARLLFLYVFVSAAFWKILRGSVFYSDHMQNLLIGQHAMYLSNHCNAYLCDLYTFLIAHKNIAQCFYVLATILELSFVIGFFTKKYDLYLLALAILFFAADHIIMLIPYWQILISGISLVPILNPERNHDIASKKG
jgi:hypothetical protein